MLVCTLLMMCVLVRPPTRAYLAWRPRIITTRYIAPQCIAQLPYFNRVLLYVYGLRTPMSRIRHSMISPHIACFHQATVVGGGGGSADAGAARHPTAAQVTRVINTQYVSVLV